MDNTDKLPKIKACPVCKGHGIIPYDFYETVLGRLSDNISITPESCKVCHGSGILPVFPSKDK